MDIRTQAIPNSVYEKRIVYGWVDGEDEASLDDFDPGVEFDPVGWC
jgi:hypothetical protein